MRSQLLLGAFVLVLASCSQSWTRLESKFQDRTRSTTATGMVALESTHRGMRLAQSSPSQIYGTLQCDGQPSVNVEGFAFEVPMFSRNCTYLPTSIALDNGKIFVLSETYDNTEAGGSAVFVLRENDADIADDKIELTIVMQLPDYISTPSVLFRADFVEIRNGEIQASFVIDTSSTGMVSVNGEESPWFSISDLGWNVENATTTMQVRFDCLELMQKATLGESWICHGDLIDDLEIGLLPVASEFTVDALNQAMDNALPGQIGNISTLAGNIVEPDATNALNSWGGFTVQYDLEGLQIQPEVLSQYMVVLRIPGMDPAAVTYFALGDAITYGNSGTANPEEPVTTNATDEDSTDTSEIDIATTSGLWVQTAAKSCAKVCSDKGMTLGLSPEGANCVSGEAQTKSAKGLIKLSYGAWPYVHWSGGKATSVGAACYAPNQKQDGDATDLTVGCFCN